MTKSAAGRRGHHHFFHYWETATVIWQHCSIRSDPIHHRIIRVLRRRLPAVSNRSAGRPRRSLLHTIEFDLQQHDLGLNSASARPFNMASCLRLWLELAWICALYKFCNNNNDNNNNQLVETAICAVSGTSPALLITGWSFTFPPLWFQPMFMMKLQKRRKSGTMLDNKIWTDALWRMSTV